MNLGTLLIKLGVDADDLDKAVSRVNAFEKKLDKFGKQMTLKATVPILATGAAAIKMASDTEESLNKVRVAFAQDSDQIVDFANTTLDSFGIARQSALDMAALFGDMGTSMGLTTKSAANMSQSLVGLAGDLASFKNIQIDQAQTALAGIFTGETESLKRLGIVMTETNLAQFALSQGINKNIKDLSQAEKVQLRYNYVLSVTKNAQGDFERTSGGAANQMRIFTEGMKETAANFGELLLPAFTSAITKVNSFVKWLLRLDAGTKKIIITVGLLVASIGPLALVISGVIKSFAAFNTLIAVMSGPVGWIIGAIVAIAAAAIYLWQNWEAVEERISDWSWWRNTLIDMIQFAIKFNPFREIATAVIYLWKLMGVDLPNPFDIVSEKLNLLRTSTKTYQHEFGTFGEAISGAMNSATTALGIFQKTSIDGGSTVINTNNRIVESMERVTMSVIKMKEMTSSSIKELAKEVGEAYEKMYEAAHPQLETGKLANFQAANINKLVGNRPDLQGMNLNSEELNQALTKGQTVIDMTSEVQMGLNDMFGSLGEGLANLFSGDAGVRSFFASLLTTVLDFTESFGKAMIAAGTAALALDKLFINPATAIAAGIALITIANLAKSAINSSNPAKMANGGVVPPGFPNDTFPALLSSGEKVIPLNKRDTASDSQRTIVVMGKLQGDDLYLQRQRNEYKRNLIG